METPQHRNISTLKCLKKSGNPSKTVFFEAFPQFLQEKRKSHKTQFLRGFLLILRHFLKFWGVSAFHHTIIFEEFPNIFEGFPNIFETFPQNFWGVSVFLKTWFSWGVSSFFWGVSAKFLRRFRIFKNLI